MKKFSIFLLSITTCYLLSVVKTFAYVNIINDWSGNTINKIQEHFGDGALVVVAADPKSDALVNVINSSSFNWVIRGHSHWLPIGDKMLNNPQEAANIWANFLKKINKTVYFEPWNEPARLDTECGNLSLQECGSRVKKYINTLASVLPSNAILTSPAWDPYHPNTPTMVGLLENIPYSVISMHIYSPGMARNYRNKLGELGVRGAGSLPVVLTETGALENGESGPPTYQENDLCNMYCAGADGQTVVDFWQSQNIIGWAIFSFAPGDYSGSWNLWDADCVIDALKGDCHCDTCKSGGKPSLRSLVEGALNRSTREASWDEAKVNRNWFPGNSTPNNEPSLLQRLFSFIPGLGNLFRLPWSLDWVPSDKDNTYPGEDPNINYALYKRAIEFNNGMAEFCVPSSNIITHQFKFFPTHHSSELSIELINQLSIHHHVFAGLKVFQEIIDWYTGSAYGGNMPYVDVFKEGGWEELAKRRSQRLTGFASKYISGPKYRELGTDWITNDLLWAAVSDDPRSPQQRNETALFDRPLFWICEGKGMLLEKDFTEKMDDGRIDRVNVDGCTSNPIPVRPSLLYCCNEQHFIENDLNYEAMCAHTPQWACLIPKTMDAALYGFYTWAQMTIDGGISHSDLPVYLESCYPTKESKCKREEGNEVFSSYFGQLSPQQRYRVLPVKVNDEPIRNSFITDVDDQCQICQVAKLFIPNALGAVEACSRMAGMSLPAELHTSLSETDRSRFYFPCDLGKGVKANGPTTNKANEDYDNPTGLAREARNLLFPDSFKVDNCSVNYNDEDVPNRCTAEARVTSRDTLYVTNYNKVLQCTNYLFGLQIGEIADQLVYEIEEANGKKVNAKNLPIEAKFNGTGGGSSLESIDEEKHWLEKPDAISGHTDIQRDEGRKLYAPGGSLELTKKLWSLYNTPAEWQGSPL